MCAGYRMTRIAIAGGHHYQHHMLWSLRVELPSPSRRLALDAGLELATLLVKHGAGLPTDWIGFERGRWFAEAFNVSLGVRIAYAFGR